MSTTFQHLPIDDNGIVQGVWRLVHASPTYDRELGMVRFEAGMATSPIAGRRLKLIIGEYGGQLFLEPWEDELPRGFEVPEGVMRRAPDALLGRLPRAPWRTKVVDALLPLVAELHELALADGQDTESMVESFNDMVRNVPALDADRAEDARAYMIGSAAQMRADGYIEIPKVLDGCIAQLDEIIAKNEPPAPSDSSAEPTTKPVIEDAAPTEGAPSITPKIEPAPIVAAPVPEASTQTEPSKAPAEVDAKKAKKVAKKEPPAPT